MAYIDDLTVRTGRAIDGQYLTDAEYEEEVKRAMREGPVEVPQVTGEELEALGIKPKSLGAEKAEKKKHDERVSDHNHPTRSKGSFRLWARDSKFLSRSRTRTTTLSTVWVWVVRKVVVYLGPLTELHRPPASSSPLCCVSTLVSPQPFGFLGAQCLGREQAEGRALKARKKFDRRGSRLCKPRGLAGLRCVSPAGRGPMGKKGGHRRDPRSNWDDLEYMLTRGLRHGDYGFRGHLSDQGRVSVRFAADQFGVSEQDIESVVSWQHGKLRLATDTDHSGRVWIRALQGHSSDSGLSKASFRTSTEADNLRDDQELMHGTFKQRVEDIISSGALKAEGAGRPGEGRLFVHWTTRVGEAGRISGIRNGCDTAFVARVGTTDNISVDFCSKVVLYDQATGKFGDEIWTPDQGYIEVALPTGDSESSVDVLEVKEGAAKEESNSTESGSPEEARPPQEAASSSGIVREAEPQVETLRAEPAPSRLGRGSAGEAASHADLVRPPVPMDWEEGEGEQAPLWEEPAADVAPVLEPVPTKEEIKEEQQAPSRREPALSRLSRGGTGEKEASPPPDRARGEVTRAELEAMWSKKPRTAGQRKVEMALSAAASSELRHQEKAREGLETLVHKEMEKSTPGGDDRLRKELKAISSAATTAVVARRRLGAEEPATEGQEYGEAVAAHVPEARERLELAQSLQVEEKDTDTRYDAGIRAGASKRKLKKDARSRLRAVGDRAAKAKQMAQERHERERRFATDAELCDAGAKDKWRVDDGIEELEYPEGSWHCSLCSTVNGADDWSCGGFLKGEHCTGSFNRTFGRWAKTRRKGPKKGQRRQTVLQAALSKGHWDCSCGQSNLGFRQRCFKCSRERPEPDLASTDEGDNVEKGAGAASKEPEAEKRDLGLRVKRKRAGAKHPKKKKRCRCGRNHKVRGGACVSRLSRGRLLQRNEC